MSEKAGDEGKIEMHPLSINAVNLFIIHLYLSVAHPSFLYYVLCASPLADKSKLRNRTVITIILTCMVMQLVSGARGGLFGAGGRFKGGTDPIMEKFNESIGFDKR